MTYLQISNFSKFYFLTVFIILQSFVINANSIELSPNDSDVVHLDKSNYLNKNLSDHTVHYLEDRQGISILDYTGNYDKNINGVYNAEARQAVLQEFYRNQEDDYDFIYIFTEFEFETGPLAAFASTIMNDVNGIGKPINDHRSSFFTEKLQTIIDMAPMSRKNFDVSNSQYDVLLDTIMHETMHRWGISVKYLDNNGMVSDRLLGEANVHWSYYLNSNASVMYGSLWQENTANHFKTIDRMHGLSPLDLYLAGFISSEMVQDTFIINNSTSGLKTDIPPIIGTEIVGDKEIISVNDIIAYEGERIPSSEDAQHKFKVKFILLKSPDEEIKPQSIADLYILQDKFQKRFFAETNGMGQVEFQRISDGNSMANPNILEFNPVLANSFDLQSAVSFILSQQPNDWWQDRDSTKVRDTVTVVKALQLIADSYPEVQDKISTAISWINNYQPQNNDEMAWMLSSNVLNNGKKQQLIDSIYVSQKSNGGWGLSDKTNASPYDTALIVDGLIQAQGSNLNLSVPTTQFVVNNINLDSGFSYVAGGKSNVLASSLLLQSIDEISTDPQHLTDLTGFILSQQLPDNSFGADGIGAPQETVFVIKALESLQDNNYINQINSAKLALDGMQSVDGSMQGSLYSTALAINVFNNNTKANLHFNEVNLSNTNVIAGEQISIDFEAVNSGAVDANNIEVTVYKDVVDINNQLGQMTINALSPNQTEFNKIVIDTTDFNPTTEVIIVIDSNNSIDENNEDDNSYAVALTTQLASINPELAFNAGLINFTPSIFNTLPFTINASTTVSNLSTENIDNVTVSLSKIEADGSLTVLQSQEASIVALSEQEFTFSTEITLAAIDIPLLISIDPNNAIAERNEENNTYHFTIEKIPSVDVEITAEDITVANTVIVGEAQNITFEFHNKGTNLASSFQVNVYADFNNDSQLIHHSLISEMSPGEILTRSFTWQPLTAGDYVLRFVLDEANELAENNESNNAVDLPVTVLANSLSNINIDNNSLIISPNPGLTGQNLNFSLTIQNNSGIDTPNFAIKVYQQNAPGIPNTLVSTLENVASIPASSNALVQWDLINTQLKGQVTLIFEVDANNDINEFNENDNILFKDIRLLTQADAQVSSGSFLLTPSTPVLGEALSVDVTVKNLGEQDLSQLSVSLYYDNAQVSNPTLISTQSIAQLAGGQSQTQTFNFTYPNDSEIDAIIVRVDELDTIDESNENNNNATILVNNQDQSLYVTQRYFSPNGDGIKDATSIVFNASEIDDYQLRILDKNLDVTRLIDSASFQNASFGDALWDGKTDDGIVARDGDYTIQLLNQVGEVIDSTTVTLDTNRTSLFESLIGNNNYFTDLNCLGSQFGEFQFAKDGRSLYTKSYLDTSNVPQNGLFEIKQDGTEIKSIIPAVFLTDATLTYYSVLDNGNILVLLNTLGVYHFYLKDLSDGLFKSISLDMNNVPQVLAIQETFAMIGIGNEYQKIYFDANTPTETKSGYQQHSNVDELNSGILIGFNGNDMSFVSYDFTEDTVLIFNSIDNFYYKISADKHYFIYEDANKVHLYAAQGSGISHVFEKDISNFRSSGITVHNELFTINNNATISLYNGNGNQLLETEATYGTENFDGLILNISPEIFINDQIVSLDVNNITDSYISQKLISHTESTDKKDILLILENSLFATFDVEPCDDNIYVCDVGEPWPTSVSDVLVLSNPSYVKLSYEDLLNFEMITSDTNVTYSGFNPVQEGRSELVLFNENNIYGFVDKTNIDNSIQQYDFSAKLQLNNIYPKLNVTEIIDEMLLQYNGNEGIDGFTCPIVTNNPFYIYRSNQNLYADITLINNQNAIEITATAFDKNFDRYELSWASVDTPNQWNLLQTSLQIVKNEIVLNWLPIDNGQYKIKISAFDKAGNQFDDIDSISINNTNSSIRNINISPKYFSPNGDGVKDIVTIDYEITTATDLLVEIQDVSGSTVRSFEREYLNPLALDTLQWDGKDQFGNILPDGRYTISVQGFNMQVILDTIGISLNYDLPFQLKGPVFKLPGEPFFPVYLNTINFDYFEAFDLLSDFEDYSSLVLQFFNQNWQDYSGNMNVDFDYNNIMNVMDGNYRVQTTDKAGNIAYTNIVKPLVQYIQVQLKKITNDNEHLTYKFLHLATDPIYFPLTTSGINDWDNGNKIAYVIQPINLVDFNTVKVLFSIIGDYGEIIESSKYIEPANFSVVSQYFGSDYIGINAENNKVHNVKINSYIHHCQFLTSEYCSLIEGDTSQYESTTLPIILIELDQSDFPDSTNPMSVQFQFDDNPSTQSRISFNQSDNANLEISTKVLTFDDEVDLINMSANAELAYHNLLNTVLHQENLEYVWVYQDNNIQMQSESLVVKSIQDDEIISVENLDADYIKTTDDYISRLYVLSPSTCKIDKELVWTGVTIDGKTIESGTNISNDFCIKAEFKSSFFMGEFCSNVATHDPRVKFDIDVEVTDLQSSLPVLVELYHIGDTNDELIFSDTSPNLIPSNDNRLKYTHSVEIDPTNLFIGAHKYKLIISDVSGNYESVIKSIFIDSIIASNEIINPLENTSFCANNEESGGINMDISANINSYSKFAAHTFLSYNGVNTATGINYSDFNDFSFISQIPSSPFNVPQRFSAPNYSGNATLLFETFNSTGVSYCSSVNIAIDSLVEFNLINEVATGSVGNRINIFSPNSDGIKDNFRLATIQALEAINIDVQLYDKNNPTLSLGTIISSSLNEGDTDDFIWDGRLNGQVVADGTYLAVISLTDDCGLVHDIEIPMTVDTTAPVSTFVNPLDGSSVNAIEHVIINIEEANFSDGTFDAVDNIQVEYFYNNVWNQIEILQFLNSSDLYFEVQLDWNLTNLPAAIYPLRITAEDAVGNISTQIINPELLETQNIFWNFNLSPLYISPNADNIKDNSTISFGLNLESVVSIDVLDSNQNTVTSVLTNQVFTSGSHQVLFNGMDDNSLVLNDGNYTVVITASESANLSNTSSLSLSVVIDNLAPQIQWLPPLSAVTKGQGTAQVQLQELNPLSLVVTNHKIVPLESNSEVLNTRASGLFDLFDLTSLDETQYQLQATATDLAGNSTAVSLDYLIDKNPPTIELTAPANEAYVGGLDGMVSITGSIDDDNFAYYDLSIASVATPTEWQVIHTDTELTESHFDYAWLSAVNDGSYLLKLSAYDQAGWLTDTSINVTLDKTPPLAQIMQPVNNSTIGNGMDIIGSANDDNFDFYTLSYRLSSDSQWQLFNIHEVSLTSASLGQLPTGLNSGNYEVKLTVVDKVGLISNHIVTVDIDVSPPPIPDNFTAVKVNDNQVMLSWDLVTANDLSGYIIYRNGQPINPQAPIIDLNQSQYLDENLADGEYVYQIVSIDTLGNSSDFSVAVTIQIDTTAPDVNLFTPADGQKVHNSIEIRGSAVSLLDFNEFKLYNRLAGQPAPGALINQSPIPVTNGLLGVLDTTALVQDSDYVIRLEANDNTDNSAFIEHTVFVDNNPPNTPLNLTGQVQNGNEVALQWDPNSDSDLAGYLVLMNGVVITGSGNGEIAIANAINQTTHTVTNLNDGIHDFNVVAIDATGNISSFSNTVQIVIDLRAPDTIIVTPITAQKFDTPILFEATSDDTDIAQIVFEYSIDNTNWSVLDTDLLAPYQVTINPIDLNLNYGNLYLRATAIDTTAKVDASPAQITVEYTDLTAPQAVQNLTANIQGGQINLNWDANSESDLAGYIVKRIVDGQTTQLTASPILTNSYVDTGLLDGNYVYQILAVDTADNQSLVTTSETLQVFSVILQQPYSPLLTPTQTQISGQSTQTDGFIQITLNNANGTTTLPNISIDGTNNPTFSSPDIDLTVGLNTFEVTHIINATHSSKTSTVQVELSPVPNTPVNFSAVVNNLSSDLSWHAPDNNTFGYLIYRDNLPVNPQERILAGISYQTSSNVISAASVSDDNPNTSWNPFISDITDNSPTFIELDFDRSYWISEIEMNWSIFNGEIREPSAYEIQYSSPVGWITTADLTAVNQQVVTHTTYQPYLTDKVRLVMKNPIGVFENIQIEELKVFQQPLLTQTSINFNEADGIYHYQVSAINNYGFESELSPSIELVIGDVVAPETVVLSAQISGLNDVLVNWNASVSADVASYWLFRNNDLILITADANTLSYTDTALANGQYDYYVRAVDAVGNASINSNTATVNIAQQALPVVQNLSIYAPLSGSSLILDWDQELSPRLDHYNIYRSLTTSGHYTKVAERTDNHYQDDGLINGTRYYYTVTVVDAFNNQSSYSDEVFATPNDLVPAATPFITSPTIAGAPISLATNITNISGKTDPGVLVDLYINGSYKTTTESGADSATNIHDINEDYDQTRLSQKGEWYAYNFFEEFHVRNIFSHTGSDGFFDLIDYTWNNKGTLLYIIAYDDNTGGLKLSSFDVNLTEITNFISEDIIDSAVPSTDETKIFYQGNYTDNQSGQTAIGLWLFDTASSSAISVPVQGEISTKNNTIAWSNDNQNVAFINHVNAGELYVYHLATNTLTLIDTGFTQENRLNWATNNATLLYDKNNGNSRLYSYDINSTQIDEVLLIPEALKHGHYSGDGTQIAYVQDCCEVYIYNQANQTTELVYTSPEPIDDLIWNQDQGIEIISNQQIITVTSSGGFTFSDVLLDNGLNEITVVSRDASGNESPASLPIFITVESTGLADLVVNSNDFIISPTDGLQGTSFVASIGVKNNGDTAVIAATVTAQLVLPDGSSENIQLPQNSISLLAGESQSIFIDLGVRDIVGDYFVQLSLDSENNIEEINENNNTAHVSFAVLDNLDPVLQVLVTPQIAVPNQMVNIAIEVYNPSVLFNGNIQLNITDTSGFPVGDPLNFTLLNLAQNETSQFSYDWDTNGIFAGQYQINTALIADNGNVLSQQSEQVVLASFADFDITLDVLSNVVNQGDSLEFSTTIHYLQGNTPQNGSVTWEIYDSNQQLVWTNTSNLPLMLTHFNTVLNNQWPTQESGDFQLKLLFNADDDQQTLIVPFSVVSAALESQLSGQIDANPNNILLGDNFNVTYTLSNSGAIDLNNIPTTIKLLTTDLGTTLANNSSNINVAIGQSTTLNTGFLSESLTTGNYLLALYADISTMGGSNEQLLDTRSIGAIDVTAPEIVVLTPQNNSLQPKNIDVRYSIIDVDGKIETITIESNDINQGAPQSVNINQVNDFYDLTLLDLAEGSHQLTITATDNFANTSQSIVNYTVDANAPIIDIAGVQNNSYYNQSVTAVVNITDDNLLSSEIQLNGNIIPANHQITDEGNYFLTVRAEDAVANVSTKNVNFTLDFTAPVINITFPENNAEIGQLTTTVTGYTNEKSVLDLNIGTYQDQVTTLDDGFFRFEAVPLQLGANSIEIQATDLAGNVSTTTLNITAVNQADITATLDNSNVFPVEQDVNLGYTLINNTNNDFNALNVKIELFDTANHQLIESEQETVDLLNAESLNSTLPFTSSDLVVGQYQAILSLFINGQWQQKSEISISLITTEFGIHVNLPLVGEVYAADIITSVDLTHTYSEPPDVQYKLNASDPWTSMVNTTGVNYIANLSLANGLHEISYRVNTPDNINSLETRVIFEIDTIAPVITVVSPVNGLITNQDVQLDYSATDNQSFDLSALLNGTNVSNGDTISNDGDYTLDITAIDNVNNQSNASVQFIIDKTNPTLVLSNLVDNQQFVVNNIEIIGTTEPFATVALDYATSHYQATANEFGDFSFINVVLAEGDNNLVFIATDRASNQSSPLAITVHYESVDACTIFGFKNATAYNAFVFNDFTAQSSAVEGRLAVGNNINISRYKIGEQLTQETAGNVLIAGGDINFEHEQVYFGNILAAGDANIGQIVIDNMSPEATITSNAQLPIDFSASYNALKLFSNALFEQGENSTHTIDSQQLLLDGDCQIDRQIYNIDVTELEQINNINYTCLAENAYLILNISGTNIQFNHVDLSHLYPVRQRTIWNFYQADSLLIHNIAIEGSILAVNALITGDEPLFKDDFETSTQAQNKQAFVSGFINGQVIANAFNSQHRINQQPLICSASIHVDSTPIATDQNLSTSLNTPIAITLDAIDENQSNLQYLQTSQVASGQLTGSMPNLTYTPETDFVGTVFFDYQVTDQFGKTSQARVTIEMIQAPTKSTNDFNLLMKSISIITLSLFSITGNSILWRRK